MTAAARPCSWTTSARLGEDRRRGTTWQPELTDVLLRANIVVHTAGLALLAALVRDDDLRLAATLPVLLFLVASAVEQGRPRLGPRGRAWLLVVDHAVLSLIGYLLVGFHSGPALLACTALLLARVFLGVRALLGLALLLLAGMCVVGWAMIAERLPWAFALDMSLQEPAAWVRTTLVAMLLVGTLGALVAAIVGQLEAAIGHNSRLCRDAQRAVQLRDEFLSVASHELRTPIAVLELAVDGLASGRVARTTENLDRSLGLIQRNVQRLTGLVGQLLDVSKIELGRLDLSLEEVDLSALVREIAEVFADGPHGSSISLDLEPSVVGRWDRSRLEQVTTNLLSNALKFGAGHAIEVGVRRADARAVLTVQDHGPGIAPEVVPHIFEQFFQANPQRTVGGLGLGLFIVDSIVRSLGGTIQVASRVGEGTTFTVDLPLVTLDLPPVRAPATEPAGPGAHL